MRRQRQKRISPMNRRAIQCRSKSLKAVKITYLSDITREQFAEIEPLLLSARNAPQLS